MQGLGDELLVPARPVGAGGVDVLHAALDGAAQHPLALVPVGVAAEVAGLAGEAHGAVPESVDGEAVGKGVGGRDHQGSSCGVAMFEAHDDGLRRRRAAVVGHAVERHEDVRLGEVGGTAARRRRVGDQPERRGPAVAPVVPLADDVDHLAVGEPERGEVGRVHEHHAATLLDAAVAVVEPVDRGVVLIVRAHRLQQQASRRHDHRVEAVDREPRPSRVGGEDPPVARAVGQGEPARSAHPPVVVVAPRDDGGDVVANGVVVGGQGAPVDGVVAERGRRDRAHDVDLAAQLRRRRGVGAAAGVDDAHRVLDRDEPLPRAGLVALGASEARQDDRLGAASHVRAVELGRDLHRERAPLHRRRRHVGVRRRGHEVAAEADEHVDLAAVHRAEGVDGVEAGLARRREAEARPRGRRATPRAASRRCPSCGRPARWSGRAPGRRRRPACRWRRAAAGCW